MLYFKSCLRCKDGTVELGSDNFGLYLNCLTCGYTINSRSIRSNGSIEKPATFEEDAVPVPVPVPVPGMEQRMEPAAVADDLAVESGEIEADGIGDDFGPDPDMGSLEEELEDFVVEEEAAAI